MLEDVQAYWEARPCGTDGDPYAEGSPEYFRWITETRYRREPFIERYARFEQWKGKDVLEVGVGAGTDSERSARAGARLTGVDLTGTACAWPGGGSSRLVWRGGSSARTRRSFFFPTINSTSSIPGE